VLAAGLEFIDSSVVKGVLDCEGAVEGRGKFEKEVNEDMPE
jgi:hypothetical protein